MTIANDAGYENCSDLPSSGTASGTFEVPTSMQAFLGNATELEAALTFETPEGTVPASWDGGGELFKNRFSMTFTAVPTFKFAVEFNCGEDFMLAIFSLPGDTIASSVRDINLLINREGDAGISADFMMTVTRDSRVTVVDAQIVRLETDDGENFEVWNTSMRCRAASMFTNSGGDNYGSQRTVMKGTASTQLISVYSKAIAATACTGITETAVTSPVGSAANFSAAMPFNTTETATKTGCVDFNTKADPSAATYCSDHGSALTDPTAPLADTTGSFSVDWVKSTMVTKMLLAD